jgi:hypothetical protein
MTFSLQSAYLVVSRINVLAVPASKIPVRNGTRIGDNDLRRVNDLRADTAETGLRRKCIGISSGCTGDTRVSTVDIQAAEVEGSGLRRGGIQGADHSISDDHSETLRHT